MAGDKGIKNELEQIHSQGSSALGMLATALVKEHATKRDIMRARTRLRRALAALEALGRKFGLPEEDQE
jgi:hypothetical protein